MFRIINHNNSKLLRSFINFNQLNRNFRFNYSTSSNDEQPKPTNKKPLPQTNIASEKLESLVPDLNVSTDDPPKIGGDTTNAKGRRSMSSIEKRRQLNSRIMMALLGIGAIAGAIHLGRDWENDQERKLASDRQKKAGDKDLDDSWFSRFISRLQSYTDVFDKPIWSELLPPPMPPPHQRPYTLLIDLEGLLVASSWDRQQGWRTAKRPGADYFLAYLSQFYEIVLFTSQPAYTAAPVIEKLDPYGVYIPYKLFRDATRYKDGKTVKDLSYLNRDLSKVIIIDTNSEHVVSQPDNAIIMKHWNGEPGNKDLIAHIPFLECIGLFNVPDVRPILKKYNKSHIPTEWSKVEANMRKKHIENWKSNNNYKPKKSGVSSYFGSSSMRLPTSPVSFSTETGEDEPPLSYLDLKRREAQAIYREEQKYWRDHADEIKKMMDEDRERQMAELKGSLWGMIGVSQDQQQK